MFVLSDVRLYAEGLAQILDREASVAVTGGDASVDEAIAGGAAVVLIDLPVPSGPEAARRIRRFAPGVRLIALAVPEEEHEVIAWAEAGIAGFLPREGSLADLVEMIHRVARGETICSPRVAAALLRRVEALAGSGTPGAEAAASSLTARELEVVRLVDRGLSNKEIARSLRIALPTVKNHVHNVLEKLHVTRRGEAASAVLRPPGVRSRMGPRD